MCNLLNVSVTGQLFQDWEGTTRYAQYGFFTLSNELNSYKLFIANYTGNAGDSLRYHNNTNFSTKNKDNDKCVDDCAYLRKGKPPLTRIKHFWTLFWILNLINTFFFPRGLLVQLLHGLQPKRRVLPPGDAHQKHRWHHLVRLAWTELLPQTGGNEDPTPELHSLV